MGTIAIYYGYKGVESSHAGVHEGAVRQVMDELDINLVEVEAEVMIEEAYGVQQPQSSFQPRLSTDLFSLDNPFDWNLFNSKPDVYAHLLIVGGTGDGKSFLCEHLAPHLGGKVIVCNPHDKPQDYPHFTKYCGGRNYGNWKKDKLPAEAINKPQEFFEKVLSNNLGFEPSVCHFIRILENEMNRRFELYHKGNFDYPMVNAILDEFCVATGKIGDGIEVVLDLIKEARKVRIRLFLLVKADQVKTLKIEGQGDIRQSLTYIRLGKFAKNHSKKIGDPALYNYCLENDHPIIVEDSLGKLPEKVVYVVPEGYEQKVEGKSQEAEEKAEKPGNNSISIFDIKPSIEPPEDDNNNDKDADNQVDNSPHNLEELEGLILEFCRKGKTTTREVQQKFQKYKLAANTIWSMFQDFANRNLGNVTEKKVGGVISRSFTPHDTDHNTSS
ncbi:MAG: hypothetical protein WBA93_07000 [Microcoleaceae cyanobacterium]